MSNIWANLTRGVVFYADMLLLMVDGSVAEPVGSVDQRVSDLFSSSSILIGGNGTLCGIRL